MQLAFQPALLLVLLQLAKRVWRHSHTSSHKQAMHLVCGRRCRCLCNPRVPLLAHPVKVGPQAGWLAGPTRPCWRVKLMQTGMMHGVAACWRPHAAPLLRPLLTSCTAAPPGPELLHLRPRRSRPSLHLIGHPTQQSAYPGRARTPQSEAWWCLRIRRADLLVAADLLSKGRGGCAGNAWTAEGVSWVINGPTSR